MLSPHCCKHTHTHARTQPTYAHSRTPTHTTCPLFFFCLFFSGERHGAMERHSSVWADAPVTRRRRGGGGGGRCHCHSYQASSSSLALWWSKQETNKQKTRGVLGFLLLCLFSAHTLKCCVLNNAQFWSAAPAARFPLPGLTQPEPDLRWLTLRRIMRPTVRVKSWRVGRNGANRVPTQPMQLPSTCQHQLMQCRRLFCTFKPVSCYSF